MSTNLTRREVCAALAAFSAFAGLLNHAEAEQIPAAVGAQVSGGVDLAHSRVFRFADLPVKNNANGGWSRAVLHGALPTGEFVEAHLSMVPPGQMPHPPHKHRNTEFVLIREGTLEYLNDGKPEPAGPGDVIFTASNVMHGMRNTGSVPALYFVVSISQAKVRPAVA